MTIGFVVYNLAISELLGLRLYKKYLRYVITQKILMVILGVSLYYLSGPEGVVLGVGLSYLPYALRIFHVIRKESVDFSLIRTRMGFLINSYVLDLSNAFIGSIDKMIVGPLFGFIVLGNFQLGIQFLSVLYIIPNIFIIIYLFLCPRWSKLYRKHNMVYTECRKGLRSCILRHLRDRLYSKQSLPDSTSKK